MEAWKWIHAGWEYVLWDKKSITNLLAEHFPWFLPTYRAYRHLHQRVDSARYFILYQYGGVYADIDTEPIRSLDLLLDKLPGVRLIIPLQPFSEFERKTIGLLLGTRYIFTNSVLAGAKRFELWKTVLDQLPAARRKFCFTKELNITFSTGPAFLTFALRKDIMANPLIAVVPSRYFEADLPHSRQDQSSYVIHSQDATWHSPALKLLLKSYYSIRNLILPHY